MREGALDRLGQPAPSPRRQCPPRPAVSDAAPPSSPSLPPSSSQQIWVYGNSFESQLVAVVVPVAAKLEVRSKQS